MKIIGKRTRVDNGLTATLVTVEHQHGVRALWVAPTEEWDVPPDDVIKRWWREDRRAFRPFNEATLRFLS